MWSKYTIKSTKATRYLISFTLITVLCWHFPYSGDDWAWGSDLGREILHDWFDNYNGRYLGNLTVIALTRVRILRTLIMSCCITGIVFCIEKIVKSESAFYISIVMLAMVPKLVLCQAIVWTSGFTNYTISIFLVLIYITYISWIFDENQERRLPRWHILPIFLLGAAGALFVEHITIYNLVLGAFALAFAFFRFKKVYVQYVSYLLGAIAGPVLMFSNSAYHSIVTNNYTTASRSTAITEGLTSKVFSNYFGVIYKEGFANNVILNLGLLLVCSLLFCQMIKTIEKPWLAKITKTSFYTITITIAFLTVSVLGGSSEYNGTGDIELHHMGGIATAVCATAIAVFLITAGVQYKKHWKIIFLLASVMCIIAPLLVVSPIGSRCFFPSYVMLVILLCEAFSFLPNYIVNAHVVKRGSILVAIGAFSFLLFIYSTIYQADKERLEHIQQEIEAGNTVLEVKTMPYETYVWRLALPDREQARYKLYYGIPEEVEFVEVQEYTEKE